MKGLLKFVIVAAGCRGWISEHAASWLIAALRLKHV